MVKSQTVTMPSVWKQQLTERSAKEAIFSNKKRVFHSLDDEKKNQKKKNSSTTQQ